MPTTNCPSCGTEGLTWQDHRGLLILADADGNEHQCTKRTPRTRARIEYAPDPPRLTEHEDMQRLAREVARLATAVEMLSSEIKDWRVTMNNLRRQAEEEVRKARSGTR